MLSTILDYLGDPADIRSGAAIVLAVLTTIFGNHLGANVVPVVDGIAGLIVAIDTAMVTRRPRSARPGTGAVAVGGVIPNTVPPNAPPVIMVAAPKPSPAPLP